MRMMMMMLKERVRTREVIVSSWSRFFWCTLLVVLSCVIFTASSSFRLLFGAGRYRPELVPRWRREEINAISWDPPSTALLSVRETVALPDQVLFFLNHPPSPRLFTEDDLDCVYSSPHRRLRLRPTRVEAHDQIVRCPLPPRGGSSASLALRPLGSDVVGAGPAPPHRWDSLVYEAVIDRYNTTVVFVKGLNLRPDKLYDPSRFECVYGWDFTRPKFLLRSDALSVAQEIIRCLTPSSVLGQPNRTATLKVSVRVKGKTTLDSIARLGHRAGPEQSPAHKPFEMCACTMLRNQAKSLREWAMYHARIGVQRFFIYDNNSEDDIEGVIGWLAERGVVGVSRHVWPWIKTQEAGFAHCALRAREVCRWVGFIDVDEFLHLPDYHTTLADVVRNLSQTGNVGELRVSCYSFGPSGLKEAPEQGVMVGYTCRLAAPERHKSIVNPEALNSTLINVVHHFHLRDGFSFVNVDRVGLVINHYKYQVWEVFKEKFYRRVATYVADWQNEENVGSKDRAPGLGTRAVEPPDWSSRFCEVVDVGLRDMVLQRFLDPETNLLPWQQGSSELGGARILKEQSGVRR